MAEDGSCARVVVSPALHQVTLVRRSADGTDAVCGVAPLPPDAGEVTLRVLVDRDSVEVFVDGGREAISAYSLPADGPRAVRLVAESDAAEVRTLTICELRSIGLDGRA